MFYLSVLIQQYSYRELFFDTCLQIMFKTRLLISYEYKQNQQHIQYTWPMEQKPPLYYFAQQIQEEPYSSGVCRSHTSSL
jgi:hypothetical protein